MKKISVEIPRSAIQELVHDTDFSARLYNAILHAEDTGETVQVKVGKARKQAIVSIVSD